MGLRHVPLNFFNCLPKVKFQSIKGSPLLPSICNPEDYIYPLLDFATERREKASMTATEPVYVCRRNGNHRSREQILEDHHLDSPYHCLTLRTFLENRIVFIKRSSQKGKEGMKLICDRHSSYGRIWNQIGMSVMPYNIVAWHGQRERKSCHVICGSRLFNAPPLSSAGAKMLLLEVAEDLLCTLIRMNKFGRPRTKIPTPFR